MSDLIGKTLGQYEVIEEIGRGGMASIFKARQTSMGREVAIKIIEPDKFNSEEFLKRFERETKTAATLSHPHILKVFDYGKQDGYVFLVMEYLGGGTLADLIFQGPLPVDQVSKILDELADALDFAHSKGIIHRDMKPQNVLLDEKKHCFITDFGIVKLMNETSAITQQGSVVGTPAYIAPEQWQGEVVDARADIYALGVTIFEMLTGKLPFQAETLYSMMKQHVNNAPPQLRALRPDLPIAVSQVLDRALAKNPKQRFPTCSELAQAFKMAITPAAAQKAPEAGADASSDTWRLKVEKKNAPPADPRETVYKTEAVPIAPETYYPPPARPGQPARNPVPPPVTVPSPIPNRVAQSQPPQDDDFGGSGKTQAMPAASGGLVDFGQDKPVRPITPLEPPPPPPTKSGGKLPWPLFIGGAVVLIAVIIIAILSSAGANAPTPEQNTQTAVAGLPLTASFTPTPERFVVQSTKTPTITVTPSPTVTLTPTITPSVTPTPTVTPTAFTLTATNTPTITPTLTETPTLTLTPTITFTPSLTFTPSITPSPTRTPTETPNPEATQTAAASAPNRALALAESATRIHGPQNGEIVHEAGDKVLLVGPDRISVTDFVAEVKFFNPYDKSEARWDYGIFFRSEVGGESYRVIIRSQGDVAAIYRRAGDSVLLGNPKPEGLIDVSAGGSNTMKLVVKGAEAMLFVNGTFVAVFDVSARIKAGRVDLATGVIDPTQSRIAGKATRFEAFTIGEIR